MIETHPFGNFVPENSKYLLIGSFTDKRSDADTHYDWYYGSKRSQFWPIIENVYSLRLDNKQAKQELFSKLSLAITDMIYQCERSMNNSLDNNLVNIVYNLTINDILAKNKIEKIFFSSKFVEKEFRKNFKSLLAEYPNVEIVTLPSPSPRYAKMSKDEKIRRYKVLLPVV